MYIYSLTSLHNFGYWHWVTNEVQISTFHRKSQRDHLPRTDREENQFYKMYIHFCLWTLNNSINNLPWVCLVVDPQYAHAGLQFRGEPNSLSHSLRSNKPYSLLSRLVLRCFPQRCFTLFCYFFLIYFENRKQKPGKGCKVQLNGYLLLFDRSIDGEVWVAAQAILMLEMCSDLCLMVFVGWLWGMEQRTQSFVWNGWTWQKGTKIFNFYLLPNFLVLFVW